MIVVVGGGLTGLALGYELQKRGVDFVVLEGSGRPGGVIRSLVYEGRVLDAGPQRARATAPFMALVEELGLRDRLVTAPADLPLYVYARGRLRAVPFSLAALLRGDALDLPARLRVLGEPLLAGPRTGESVEAFFTRKLGRQAYERVAGPLYGGLFGTHPKDMDVATSLGPALKASGVKRSMLLRLLRRGGKLSPPPSVSFDDGLEVLTTALADHIADAIQLSAPVLGLARDGGGWRVETGAGDVAADQVVLTVPADAAAGILDTTAPETARALGALPYNPVAVVHLESGAATRGIGFRVALGEPPDLLRGVTFNHALFDRGRDRVFTAFLGSTGNADVAEMDDGDLAEAAATGFARYLGRPATALAVARQRMPAWDVSWRGLRNLPFPRGVRPAGAWWSRPGIVGRLAEARSLAARLAGGPPGSVRKRSPQTLSAGAGRPPDGEGPGSGP